MIIKLILPGKEFVDLLNIISEDIICNVELRDFILDSFLGKRLDLYEQLINKL